MHGNESNDRPRSDHRHPIERKLFRWLAFALLGCVATAASIYLGDSVVYLLRGKPQDQITVTRYMAAPLKGDKTELYYEGTGPRSCARALLSQNGLEPCWYLRRHPLAMESD